MNAKFSQLYSWRTYSEQRPIRFVQLKNLPRAARFRLTTVSILLTCLTCNGKAKSRLNIFHLEIHLQSWEEQEPTRSMPLRSGVSYFPDLVLTIPSQLSLSLAETLPGCFGHPLPTASSSWSFSCNCSASGSCPARPCLSANRCLASGNKDKH